MAIREKTVHFAFPQLNAAQERTETNFTQIQVFIPEANPTFTSVCAEVGFEDIITATGGTIGETRVGLRLGAAALTIITELDDIQNSGENIAGVIGPFDFTTHFNNNWSGTSMNCDAQVYFEQTTGTTENMRNITFILKVTYTYDDTAPIQIKTVAIPIDSPVSFLPTAIAEVSANSIPQLTGAGGILPEAGVTIRSWFVVFEGNDSNAGTADFILTIDVDGTQSTAFPAKEAALATNNLARYIYKPATVPATTAAHALRASCSQASKYPHATFTLYVTYEFTLAGTTRTLNSIFIPMEIASPVGAQVAGSASRFSRQMFIQEPGSIVQRHCAIRLNWNTSAGVGNVNIRAGTQAYQAYANTVGVSAGMYSVQRKFDSASMPLTRGLNDIDIDVYTTSAAAFATNVGGYILLNYESDVSSQGIGAHNHTVFKKMFDWDAASAVRRVVANISFPIAETNYWLVGVGFYLIIWNNIGANAITLDAQVLATEGKGAGYYDLYADAYNSDAEQACSITWGRGRDVFRRFPQDEDADRLNIESARSYRVYTPSITKTGGMFALTYHAMTWTVAGSISGHDPALPTLVKLVKVSSEEVLQMQTLPAGTTAFSFVVYDNTEDYYIDAFQDATHVGRSANAKAV